MLELNISFDVLLECFSNFFTNMSMTAVSLLGNTDKKNVLYRVGSPVQNELRTTAL